MRLLTVKEASAITGLTECELRLGAKQGRYPFIRTGKGGAKAPYLFDIDLLNKAIKNLMEQNIAWLQYYADARCSARCSLRRVLP